MCVAAEPMFASFATVPEELRELPPDAPGSFTRVRARTTKARRSVSRRVGHQSCIEPSRRRLTGR
jgi:hypothetical protein